MSQSLISHHLADLRQANLVVNQKKGRRVYYQLTNLGQQLVAALTKMKINYH
jgi:DNA-binding HxlR family transcriptional regulator